MALLGGALWAGVAHAERTQHGNLIVSLDGGLAPLKLPRDRAAPVAVHLEGGLRTADDSPLPRVTRVELELPGPGVLSTRGLPICPPRRLRNAKAGEALAACGQALVGRGSLEAEVLVPSQAPFTMHALLLAFNGRVGGQRAVIFHLSATDPPTVAVVPFLIRHRSGGLGTALVANLSSALGPWPRFAQFAMTLSRRYTYRGQSRSYLSASCPIPPRLTAGFLSPFAKASFTLFGGRRVSTSITRGCRAS
jgi:hypothetical protein